MPEARRLGVEAHMGISEKQWEIAQMHGVIKRGMHAQKREENFRKLLIDATVIGVFSSMVD